MLTLVLGTQEDMKPRMSWSLYIVENKEYRMGLGIMFDQEPMSRSMQLHYISVTAFL